MARPVTEEELREAYHATIDALYAFVSRRCDGDRDLAEDVTQETWLRAVRTWHSDGLPQEPLAWLTTVSRNLLANHFRRRPTEPIDDGVTDERVSALDEGAERQTLVRRALARLPRPQFRLLEAFHFERKSVSDIAASHGLSERAVEGRLRRARLRLRHQIESDPDSEGDLS